jgi:penicillin-binding protein 1A
MQSRGIRILLAAIGLLGVAGVIAAAAFYVAFVRDLPDLEHVRDYRPSLTSTVVDRNGRMIGEFYVERRRLTPLEEVPDHVVRAFIAAEDSAFYEHSGIDLQSILRAAWKNLITDKKEGGSTITQQMVKGLLLTPERTYRRKIREMILAHRIEERFSKQDILYLYLNQIYFGEGAYGIGEAAHTYFGKDVGDLTISEGAQLAGLPKAPTRYSPRRNPDQAEKRRRYVLERMKTDGFLDEATYESALAEPLTLASPEPPEAFHAAAYFTEGVRRYLFDQIGGKAVLEGGLRIETTIDRDLQIAAHRAVRKGLEDLSKRQGYRGPLRNVPETEIPETLAALAEKNGLVLDADDPEAPAPMLPAEGRLEGVVTAVDPAANQATVGFAPGVSAVVTIQEVSWARKPNPERAPYRVRKIQSVFKVGDVAVFEMKDEKSESGEPLVALHQEPLVEGALLSMDVDTQEVLALVGGYDFARSEFDRVTQARRQPGSSFKPFIYGAALAKNYTPASIIFDRPVVYKDEESGFVWRPRNYGRAFYGPITLREALARSVNNATVHLFRDVGVDFVIDYARRLGIKAPLNRDLSLALGSSDVSLLELTRAYAVFAAQGLRVEPIFIRKVTDRDGQVLFENVPLARLLPESDDTAAPPDGSDPDEDGGDSDAELAQVAAAADGQGAAGSGGRERILSPEEAYLVADLLRAVVIDPHGTGWRLKDLRRPVAGKTGTTNDQADAWFLGFSPDIATGVWVGHDESRFLGWGETGSRAAAPIWVDYMRTALADRPVRDFQAPESIVFARIDRKTGLLADATSKDTVFQAFLVDTVPTETAKSVKTETEGRRLLRMDDL